MKNFIYKYLLKPKHERTPTTEHERIVTRGITAITVLIGLMIFGHYFVEMFKYERMSTISDVCRVKFLIVDNNPNNENEYLCKSAIFDNYYQIDTNDVNGTNIYINRRFIKTDDGKFDGAMYKNPLQYTAH
jgi:hypothetical protein